MKVCCSYDAVSRVQTPGCVPRACLRSIGPQHIPLAHLSHGNCSSAHDTRLAVVHSHSDNSSWNDRDKRRSAIKDRVVGRKECEHHEGHTCREILPSDWLVLSRDGWLCCSWVTRAINGRVLGRDSSICGVHYLGQLVQRRAYPATAVQARCLLHCANLWSRKCDPYVIECSCCSPAVVGQCKSLLRPPTDSHR